MFLYCVSGGWWKERRREGKKGCLDLIFLALFLTQRPSKWAVSGTSQVAVTHLTASLDQAPRQSPLTVIRKWPRFHRVNVGIVHSWGGKKSLKNDTCHWFISLINCGCSRACRNIHFNVFWGSSYQLLCLQLQGRKLIIRGKMKLGESFRTITIKLSWCHHVRP